MATDSFDINIKGLGTGGSSTSGLDTSSFQDSLTKLTLSLKNAAESAASYTKSMKETEAKLSQMLKKTFSSSESPTAQEAGKKTKTTTKEEGSLADPRLLGGLERLSHSIDKLTGDFKSSKVNETPERFGQQVKALLATVGIGSLVKSVVESNIINPARNTGYLIGSNVLANPVEAGSNLIESFQKSQASTNTAIATGIGGALGFGLGGTVGAGVGAALGGTAANLYGQFTTATEIPIQQRALQRDFYQNISEQQPRLGAFAQNQYQGGFGSNEAFLDPYFQSKANFGRSFSRYSEAPLNAQTTTGIVGSLSAQGLSSPGDLANIGGLLGQIAKFSGKTSDNTAEVYKSLERTGVNPIEGAQRLLGLLQGGMSVEEAQDTLKKTANSTDVFAQGQTSYLGSSPFNRIRSQFLGQISGVNPEEFFAGGPAGEASAKKAQGIFKRSNAQLRRGIKGSQDEILAEILYQQGITPGMINESGQVMNSDKNIQLSRAQDKTVELQKTGIETGLKGRTPSDALDDAINSIAKSTQAFGALDQAVTATTNVFAKIAHAFDFTEDKAVPKTVQSQKAGGR